LSFLLSNSAKDNRKFLVYECLAWSIGACDRVELCLLFLLCVLPCILKYPTLLHVQLGDNCDVPTYDPMAAAEEGNATIPSRGVDIPW
jgi:hypothetical protein